MKFIESKDNPKFKEIIRFKKSGSKGDSSNVFLEGFRLCNDAILSGVLIKTLILSNKVYNEICTISNISFPSGIKEKSYKCNKCDIYEIKKENENIKSNDLSDLSETNDDINSIKKTKIVKSEITELNNDAFQNIVNSLNNDCVEDIIVLKDSLFETMTSTNAPQGIAAIAVSPVLHSLDDLEIKANDKFIICESVQDPGNFGSIIRSADAFGFSGVIYTNDTVDPFNEKVLRSSMGSAFHLKLIETQNIIDAINMLKGKNVTVYASHLQGEKLTKDFKFKSPCAIIMGNEGNGISKQTSDNCDILIKIPMPGSAESLNVSNAAAILCYHATIL